MEQCSPPFEIRLSLLYIVLNNVPTFSANMRKLVYSLYCSLRKSDNVLVQTALNCDIYSTLFAHNMQHKIL